MDTRYDPETGHADYPHEPGTLYDCAPCERQMEEEEMARLITRAQQEGEITLKESDFVRIGGELFLDGMDPDEWIDAMLMD